MAKRSTPTESARGTARGSTAEGTEERSLQSDVAITWLLQRMREDPQFLEKLKEEAAREEANRESAAEREERDASTSSLDDILAGIADLLAGSGEAQPAPSSPAPRPAPAPGSSTMPSNGNGAASDPLQFRKMMILELMYMMMIPPVDPSILITMHERIHRFLELLKSLKNNPYLRDLVDRAIEQATTTTSNDGARSTIEDPELVALAQQMANDIVKPSEDRLLPVAALLIGAAVAAAVGGVTVGRAVHEATH